MLPTDMASKPNTMPFGMPTKIMANAISMSTPSPKSVGQTVPMRPNILSLDTLMGCNRHLPMPAILPIQNYRSTKNILNAANEVIRNNKGRKDKRLWTENEEGDLIVFHQYETEYEEANQVLNEIEKMSKDGIPYKNMAILYRTNAQSRVFEEKFLLKNIPYKIVGGVNFYSRKEIKDILAYLKAIDNGQDDLAVKRIICWIWGVYF